MRQSARTGPLVVWTTWAGLFAGALILVGRYGHNVPYYDGWSLVYTLAGVHPIDLDWLWEPRNGHRLVVPKLVVLALYELTGWDFRTGMYASVLLLAGASALLMVAASRSRGSVSHADAAIPLLLLNWGHYDNMLWGWQLTQVLPIAVACALLAVVVRWGLHPPFRIAVLAAIGVLSLPLSGVPGLACTPGFAFWLLECGRRRWSAGAGTPRQEAGVLWGLTALALLLVPAYFIGLPNPGVPPPDPRLVARTLALFSTHGLGPVAGAMSPWSVFVVALLYAWGALVLLRGMSSSEPAVHSRAVALLFAMLAFGGIAASVAVARPTTDFPHRYYLFAVPALLGIHLAIGLVPARALARGGQTVMLALAVAAAIGNTPFGWRHATARGAAMSAFEEDVRAGMPPSRLIARHQRTLLPFPEDGGFYWHDQLAFSADVLRRSGVGVFSALAPEADMREIPLEDVAERARLQAAPGSHQVWEWTMAEPRTVAGLRIRKPAGVGESGGATTLEWADEVDGSFSRERRALHWWTEGEDGATVWIYDTVGIVRLTLPAAPHIVPLVRLLVVEP